jgi:hypothetical protein
VTTPELAIAVDPRIELVCAVFELADAVDRSGHATPYRAVRAEWLASHADHPVIAATQTLRSTHGIAFDAPLQLAVHLDPEPPHARLIGELVDPRWRALDVACYVEQLADFARASELATFLAAQQPYFAAVEHALWWGTRDEAIVAWYQELFAERAVHALAPGLSTGPMSYGLRGAGGRFVVVACLEDPDEAGVPRPTWRTLEVIVHELAHCYLPPLLAPHLAELVALIEPSYAVVADQLARRSYTTAQIALEETVVRALALLYLHDRLDDVFVARALREHEAIGLPWVGDVARTLDALRVDHRPLDAGDLALAVRRVFAPRA